MKLDPLLSKAAVLAKKRDYEAAMKILRDEEDRYSGSFKYYYLCGVINLYMGAFMEAKHFFERARKIKIKDVNTLLGLSVLFLNRLDTVRAVDYYLDIQELDQGNRIAKKALTVIRAHSTADALSDWITAEKLSTLFPPIPAPLISTKTILTAVGIFAVILVFLSGLLINRRIMPNPFINPNARPTADFVLSGQERSAPVETGGSYMYILTRDQAIRQYESALNLFSNYRDEAAKVHLNRILESNASDSLKNRARILLSNMEVPGFDNFKRGDNPSYADVRNEGALYRDVHVIWRGMATNVEITNEHTRFDFLVGYDTRRTLEGIVTVTFLHPIAVNTERPLELLGRVVQQPSGDIQLEGIAIHQSGRLED